MYSTIGNSTIPANGSTLVSTTADTPVTLSFYQSGNAVPITTITGAFTQLVVLNQGATIAYVSVDSGSTWQAIPAGQSLVYRQQGLLAATSVQVARAQGGSNATNISAWAH